jgi:DNA/RNA-binding domain of Phe-tRNA-synthetase-like protein
LVSLGLNFKPGEQLLTKDAVSPEIFQRYPDYTVALIEVSGIQGGESRGESEALLLEAESVTRELLSRQALDELDEVQAWRAAYESFGVKPREGRASFEALMRRVDKGLPRIDLLTDIYNAVSVIHRVPIGGENLDQYQGPPRLVIAQGDEEFVTRANGEDVTQNPTAGEVIWRDDIGVTCRRWNWRQCIRTRLDFDTKSTLFIIDALGPDSVSRATTAADRLLTELRRLWPDLSDEVLVIHR